MKIEITPCTKKGNRLNDNLSMPYSFIDINFSVQKPDKRQDGE